MTDENDGAAGAGERGPRGGRVVGDGVQMVLGRDHLETISLKKRNDLTETRPVGPKAMRKHNCWFVGHAAPPKDRLRMPRRAWPHRRLAPTIAVEPQAGSPTVPAG